jgi:hypothetical protein
MILSKYRRLILNAGHFYFRTVLTNTLQHTYFLRALSNLATRPELVISLLRTRTLSQLASLYDEIR